MTKFSKHIAECSERASKISEEEDQNDNFGEEEGEEREEEHPEEVLESRTGTDTMSTNKRIQRYLVAVEYIGTKFSGSQKQLNCRTVVGVLEVFALFLVGFLEKCLFLRLKRFQID